MSSPMHGRKAIHFASLRAKLAHHGKASLALRLLLAAALAGFLLVFAARTLLLPSSSSSTTTTSRAQHDTAAAAVDCANTNAETSTATATAMATAAAGGGVPHAVMEALVHYTTSNVTPQQTADEIGVSLRVLQRRAPCNFLVFGLGHDSPMWAALNHGGRTVFLEEDASWISTVRASHPSLESYHVSYDTVLTDADSLLELRHEPACVAQQDLAAATAAECRLALSLKGLPQVFHDLEWDLIMVDAPTGWTPQSPGRMGAIYTAGMVARARRPGDGATDVFVHDVNRPVEDAFSKAFLCEGYLAEQVGRIRHFVIPSHREKEGTPFCP